MLAVSVTDQALNTMEDSAVVYESPNSATIDAEVTIVEGSEFNDSAGTVLKPSYFVELGLDDIRQMTSERKAKKGQNSCEWDETFIFTANRTSRLSLKLYCRRAMRSDVVIGEANYSFWDIPRHRNVQIDLQDPVKSRVSGKITLCLKVAASLVFSAGPVSSLDLESLYSIRQMTKIVESLSGEGSNKLSSVWLRFIQSLDTVASNAQKISELHPPVQIALGAVAFALKAVLDGIARDERIDNMVGIMGDLHAYVADTYSIQKIASYKSTLRTLLAQTTECSYFIGDYRKVTQFAQRAVVNLVSNADDMIRKFENTFQDLKIQLILGSSLQTAVVSFRILQKVENIETMMYIDKLKPLEHVGWAPSRTCLRGTRKTIINDLVQWASNSAESEMGHNSQIYVLQGPPGCGKSCIAHSVAEAFHLQNRLGAAIFLDDRIEDRVIRSQILSTTIASQLAFYDQSIGVAMAAKLKVDASLANAEIERQFPGLIVSATEGLALIGPICIIIDGLENIVNSAQQFRVLATIADYFKILPPNFRLLLTARYGRTSKDIAQLLPDSIIKRINFQDEGTIDYNEYISQSICHLFSKKSKLSEKYTIDGVRDHFIERSMGIYFWLSTARQLLLSCPDGDECMILENILSTEPPRTKEEAMDQLFRIIITYNLYIPFMCHSLIQSSKPLRPQDALPWAVTMLESTYQLPFFNMMQRLGILIEDGRDGTDNILFSIHPSLEDFLTSSRRCYGTTFYIDRLRLAPASSLRIMMVDACFEPMERWLRQNICNLDDTMALNEEISDRDSRLCRCIPEILRYACRNWIFHIEGLDDDEPGIKSALKRLNTFLSKHLLQWIECMSLLGSVHVIPTSLDRLRSWLDSRGIPHDDDRQVLTMDAIQFIQAFTPIISKAAMQTYHSALPLMPSDSLLSQKYSVMSRPSLKSEPGFRYSESQIVECPEIRIPTDNDVYDGTIFGEIIALSLYGGIAFFNTRTGKEIGSRIPTTPDYPYLISFSPDGQWLVTQPQDPGHALDIWNVQTRTRTKTIAIGSDYEFKCIKYSAGGDKIMLKNVIDSVFILDTKTDNLQHLKQIELGWITDVAISPDGSQIAFGDELDIIKIIDVSTGDPIGRGITPSWNYDSTPRIAWSPNGQFVASAVTKRFSEEMKIGIFLLSLTPGPTLSLLGSFTTDTVFDLAFSLDSSKVVVGLQDYNPKKATLSIWCTRSASLVGRTSFNSFGNTISFSADGRDILISAYENYNTRDVILLLRFSIVPPHLETYMDRPPKFHSSQFPHTIEYSHYISGGAIDDYASHVDADGWILNTKGEREIWTPCANYELLCSCQPPPKGQTQHRTLKVQDPETKIVVLIYVISFEQKDVDNGV